MTSPDDTLTLQSRRLMSGRMRKYERVDDGPWHDGLLMDLLADGLTG
jgi:hypothetical protein